MRTTYERTPHPLFDALLDEMRKRNGDAVRNNDAALCRMLNVLPPTLSKMRKGKLPVSDTVRVRIQRAFDWKIKQVDQLAPPAAAEEGQAH